MKGRSKKRFAPAIAAAVLAMAPLASGALDAGDALLPGLLEHRRDEAEAKQAAFTARMGEDARRTANQDDYDALHYDLVLNLNPVAQILTGTVTITARVTGASIATLDLNLQDFMAVSAATSAGLPATFSHLSHILTVNLDRSYDAGETVVVTVDYAGDPSADLDHSYFGWDEHEGLPAIWSKSEPYGARHWWPCKDQNDDKADGVDLHVTVPSNLICASQGLLQSVDLGPFTKTYHWSSAYPISTYLVSVAAHPYQTYSQWYVPQGGGAPMEIQNYVYADWFDETETVLLKTRSMLEFYSPAFGEYPFVNEKYGHAHFPWGGGMEHQTLTSLRLAWEDGVAHELAHQWFGDSVTCADFGHIWLNEGFATWSEALWMGETRHQGYYRLYMELASYYGAGTVFVEDPLNENIFSYNLSYNKASWVVHMLRKLMGDPAFFSGIRDYTSAYAYSAATTEQFRDVMELASGMDLDAFFTQWIYGNWHPDYEYAWTPGAGGDTIDLVIDQVQTEAGPFAMPVDVRVTYAGGATADFVAQTSQASESFSLPVAGQVDFVQIDPDDNILCKVRSQISDPTFHRGVLLVNGVHWGLQNSVLEQAYAAEVYTGTLPYTFWDAFYPWDGTYPPLGMPEPLGFGSVPGEVLEQFSTVVWVGDSYYGDVVHWQETPILEYLAAGGNVIHMGRLGRSYLEGEYSDYLGIEWLEEYVTLDNWTANYPGLIDQPFTDYQNAIDVFSTAVGQNSTLLFTDTEGGAVDRGVGVHAQPPGGGSERPSGGHFIHLAGRGYRMDHDTLRSNTDFLLRNFCGEPFGGTPAPPAQAGPTLRLEPGYPNPFNPRTVLAFSLAAAGEAKLAIYDASGRLVRVLATGEQPAGFQERVWDGRNASGEEAASGLYLARLIAGGEMRSTRLIMLR